jgi:glucose-1-phosphate cytidylyltransferase
VNRSASAVLELERRHEPAVANIKVGILAGGNGTRIAEETETCPKPMVEIGGRPMLWHIMMHYAHHGFRDFAVALGHQGQTIERDLPDHYEPAWNVDLVDTGDATMTGGRIKRLKDHLGDSTFMLTWGDGVSDVNLHDLLKFHRHHGRLATVTAVRPPARFGRLDLVGDRVVDFAEKPQLSEGWINGAFFILEPGVFDYIDGDATQWEHEPLQRLARDGELMAYKHTGFWQCMDTLRDKRLLESLWDEGNPPWRIWDRPATKKTTAA